MSTQDTGPTVPPLASVVRRRCVPPAEIARYYLRTELPNVVVPAGTPAAAAAVSEAVDGGVVGLSEYNLWRLLEALSFRYRLNRVFTVLSDTGVDWHEVDLPLSAITMTGVMPTVDDIVYSSQIGRSPERFVVFLREYFAAHADDDPRGLEMFRPRGRPIRLEMVLLETEDGRPAMLDGTSRLVEMALAGARSVRGYWAIPNGKPRRGRAGDSAFVQLRDLYLRHEHEPEAAAAILATARLLGDDSVDGRSAVETYWVEHPRDPRIRKVGAALVARLHGAG